VRDVDEDTRPRLICTACGTIHYENPRVVAAALAERDGRNGREALLMRRAWEPRRGYWSPPGGFVEIDETVEAAAIREAEEEVGLRLELQGLLGVYSRPIAGIVVVVFRARALNDEPKVGAEALEARWFAVDGVPWDRLAFETTAQALQDWVSVS
jgi:ADP-ribose pyrophosphatase YjhB (NUDIX family)